jgi:hypothetical protein
MSKDFIFQMITNITGTQIFTKKSFLEGLQNVEKRQGTTTKKKTKA